MSKAAKIIACAALAATGSVTYAAAIDLTRMTAPDAVSRTILSKHVRFGDGALSKADLPAAIHRNYSAIVEQNFARMDATHAKTYVDQLSDAELQDMAQLYANANADAHRNGSLLLVAANRMDGVHLARLSKFFGYTPVYNAILSAAPLKAQSFAQNAPIQFEAPTPTPIEAFAGGSYAAAVTIGGATGGTYTPMQFKPNVSMTLKEIYTGFRGMMVGESAATAALYETTMYAGGQLTGAWIGGYAFGTYLTNMAQEYAPDWYYGPFVDAVGNSVSWFQNTVTSMGTYTTAGNVNTIGLYQQYYSKPFTMPEYAVTTIEATGGDDGYEGDWEQVSEGSGKCGYNPSETCNKN